MLMGKKWCPTGFATDPSDTNRQQTTLTCWTTIIWTTLKNHSRVEPRKEEHRERLEERSANMKIHYDLNRQNNVLPPLYPGQCVRILNRPINMLYPRTIIQKDEKPRSYVVKIPNGVRLRRNRTHLRVVPVPVAKKVHFANPEPGTVDQEKTESRTKPPTSTSQNPQSERDNNQQDPFRTKSGWTIRTPSRYKNSL